MSSILPSPFDPDELDRSVERVSEHLDAIEDSLAGSHSLPVDFTAGVTDVRREMDALQQRLRSPGAKAVDAQRKALDAYHRLHAVERAGIERQIEAAQTRLQQTQQQVREADDALKQARRDLATHQQALIASLEADAERRRRIITVRHQKVTAAGEAIKHRMARNVIRAKQTTFKRRVLLISAGVILILTAVALLYATNYRMANIAPAGDFTTSLLLNVGTESLITGALLLILELVFSLWEGQKDSADTQIGQMQWEVEQARLAIEVEEAALQAIEAELSASREG